MSTPKNVAMLRRNTRSSSSRIVLWSLYSTTCDKIHHVSSHADTDLRCMVLLCNTLDFIISLGQKTNSSGDIHRTEGKELEHEHSPFPSDSSSPSDFSDIDDLYEVEDFKAPVHPKNSNNCGCWKTLMNTHVLVENGKCFHSLHRQQNA
jgi:hypothetical protein